MGVVGVCVGEGWGMGGERAWHPGAALAASRREEEDDDACVHEYIQLGRRRGLNALF